MNVLRLSDGWRALVLALVLAVTSVRAPLAAEAAPAGAQRCTALAKLALPQTTISVAEEVRGGTFQPPVPTSVPPITRLPPFCRVAGTIAPQINFEVWLPVADWNRKFFGIGQGGFAGKIVYITNSDSLPGLADVLRRGYAAASTDTGHSEPADRYDASWVLAHPESREIFGYRAVHEMTAAAQAIVQAYYGMRARHSYYAGCSGGGRQGLTEAERYPSDYDGIMAMAAANPIELMAWIQNISKAVHAQPANRLAPAQLPLIRKAVLDTCDANDGVVDGLIGDARRCDFAIEKLQCSGPASAECLTREQVGALKYLYRPVKDRAGNVLFAALPPGQDFSGALMPQLVAGRAPWGLADQFFRYWVYADPTWKSSSYEEGRALEQLRKTATPYLSASPDLRRYRERGGRLLLVHGWADEGIPPQVTIDYYQKLIDIVFGAGGADAERAQRADDFARLFMVPGMNHCRGGPGPTEFDTITALDKWVSEGVGPQRIVASHYDPASGVVDRTRPLCGYPLAAVYQGKGSIDDENNFRCDLPPAYGRQPSK